MRKFRLSALALGAALLLSPAAALAERHRIFIEPRVEVYEHHHHFRPHRYYYRERVHHGYYDSWGYWHPYR